MKDFDDAIHEDLDEIGPEQIRVPATAHLDGVGEIRERPAGQHTERHAPADRQLTGLLDLTQQFELVEIAVHIVEAGDAERGAIGQSLPYQLAVDRALRARW